MTVKCFLVTAAWFRLETRPPHSRDLVAAEFFILHSENCPQQKTFGHQEHQEKHTCQLNAVPLDILNELGYTTF